MKPWYKCKISECNESLISIPSLIHRLNPHPYQELGAPYGDGLDPWRLRVDVVRRLLLAQNFLKLEKPSLCFILFDAWRPIAVQAFMVNYVINQQCLQRGINRYATKDQFALKNVIEEVNQFWATPTSNPCMPPPHSTGAAIDLTLGNPDCDPLEMGSEIDVMGEVSMPDYFSQPESFDDKEFAFRAHSRRMLLAKVMQKAGFIQHPNEWWHFSYGDQLWAWRSMNNKAIYGALAERSKANTD